MPLTPWLELSSQKIMGASIKHSCEVTGYDQGPAFWRRGVILWVNWEHFILFKGLKGHLCCLAIYTSTQFQKPYHFQSRLTQWTPTYYARQPEYQAKKNPRHNSLLPPQWCILLLWHVHIFDGTVVNHIRSSPESTTFRNHRTPFHQMLCAITWGRWVLKIIHGYSIQFHFLPRYNFSFPVPSCKSLLQVEQVSLLHLGAGKEVPNIQGRNFYPQY